MKFTSMSDLHLEFASIKIPCSGADVLLLAGDIGQACLLDATLTDKHSRHDRASFLDFFTKEVTKYPETFYIMGNHEHYGGMWENTAQELREWMAKNAPTVTILDKETVKLSDTLMLWGGTLWTDFSHNDPSIRSAARMGMNDYRLIAEGYDYKRNLRTGTVLDDHMAARKSLFDAVDEYPEKDWLIMSHHGPSWRSIDLRYGGEENMLNYCYVTDLDPEIESRPQIKAWVHGHTHVTHMYTIGDNCRVICNPRGYATMRGTTENEKFNPELVFEL